MNRRATGRVLSEVEGMRSPLRDLLRQVDQQDFSVFGCFDRQLFLFGYGRTVSLMQLFTVQFDFALRDLQPPVTLGAERLGDLFSGGKESDKQLRILIDLYRALGTVVGCDQSKLAALLHFG